jgi:site-specific DNA recombinase
VTPVRPLFALPTGFGTTLQAVPFQWSTRRGLIKCGLCGLTYVGTSYTNKNGVKSYYGCNGKNGARGIYGKDGKRCPAKSISGTIEDEVWHDIEGFLGNPGSVLEQLQTQMQRGAEDTSDLLHEIAELRGVVQRKDGERNLMLSLYRKGTIDERTLDQQLADVTAEEDSLRTRIQELEGRVRHRIDETEGLRSAEALLRKLHSALDQNPTWETKRQIVELLVSGIRVDTLEEDGVKRARVNVTYRFDPPQEQGTTVAIGMDVPAGTMATRSSSAPAPPRSSRATRSASPAPCSTA